MREQLGLCCLQWPLCSPLPNATSAKGSLASVAAVSFQPLSRKESWGKTEETVTMKVGAQGPLGQESLELISWGHVGNVYPAMLWIEIHVWVKGFWENFFSFWKLFSYFVETGNYTCEFCGKQYKYYTPYQEHVALHAPISEYPAVTQQPGRPWDPGSFKAELKWSRGTDQYWHIFLIAVLWGYTLREGVVHISVQIFRPGCL